MTERLRLEGHPEQCPCAGCDWLNDIELDHDENVQTIMVDKIQDWKLENGDHS